MLYKDDEVEARLAESALHICASRASVEVPIDRSNVVPLHKGKADKDSPQLSDGKKRLLGTMAYLEGTKKVADATGITPASISQYRNGRTGVHKPDEEGRKSLETKKAAAQESAIDKLLAVVGLLDDEKLECLTKAKEITSVAKDLSTIVGKLTGKEAEVGIVNNIVYYSPTQKEEKEYEVIDV